MTIGIAHLRKKVVILAADGRECRETDREILSDEKNKIIQVSPHVAMVGVGVSNVIEVTSQILDSKHNATETAEETCEVIDSSLEAAWERVLDDHPDSEYLRSPRAHVTLLVGGICQGQTFITSITRQMDVGNPYTTKTAESDSEVFLVECNHRAHAWSNFQFQRTRDSVEKPSPKNHEEETELIIDSAVRVIRHAETTDDLIGGMIRYVVIEEGKPISIQRHKSNGE